MVTNSFVTATSTGDNAQNIFISEQTNFYDTARITGIQILDSTGNPVDNWTIASESGLNYTPNGLFAPAPEPGSICLLTVGLLGLVLLSRRLRCH